MKKAVIIGGSNGIGLAIARDLLNRNYHIHILDISQPDNAILSDPQNVTYSQFNLIYPDWDLVQSLSNDPEVEGLMITAGIGRVAEFEYLHPSEIQNIFQINTVTSIQIIRYFYDRMKSHSRFFCGIMGSIAGLCSSPLFSVYAASKAAVCRFAESVNIELEKAGVANRILNVSPGSIAGTRFNGGENDISKTQALAGQIVEALLASQTLLIPQYDEVFQGVLDRYHRDPRQYGLDSYDYKTNSGRVCNEHRARIGYLSGTFDLFHVGHLNLLKRAKQQCDYLIVGVHPDASHKGKETFIPFQERMAIVGAVKYVDKVVPSCKEDSDAWALWKYTKLFVGSDYKGTERFNRYEAFFADKGVQIVYFPYTQSTSSTQIRNTIMTKKDSGKE